MLKGLSLALLLVTTSAAWAQDARRAPVIFSTFYCGGQSRYDCSKSACEAIGYKKYASNREYGGDSDGRFKSTTSDGGNSWLTNLVCFD